MKQLEYVNFASNSLSTFPPIMGSPRLRCLLLHSNHLSSLPVMPTLPHLHTLDLACNHFESVPDLSNFPRLEFLDLSGNTKLTISKASIKVLKYVPSHPENDSLKGYLGTLAGHTSTLHLCHSWSAVYQSIVLHNYDIRGTLYTLIVLPEN